MAAARLLLAGAAAALLAAWPAVAYSHDPSQYGGLFRTRDGGVTWTPAVTDRYVSAVLALAVSPADANHLLMGTDTGLYRSRNGGRDWRPEAREAMVGAVTAVAFDERGQRALAAGGAALLRDDGRRWSLVAAPAGRAPARALVTVGASVYLVGRTGLYRSDDFGASWASTGEGLPREPVTALAASGEGRLYAAVGGRVFASAGGPWRAADVGLPAGAITAVQADPGGGRGVWAAGRDRLFRGEEGGAAWWQVGAPLPDRDTRVRGVAVAGPAVLMTTSRGLYRSPDAGGRWEQVAGRLPAHLEAAPLVSDPADARTWYAGFSVVPYDEILGSAGPNQPQARGPDAVNLAAGAGFLAAVALAAALALRWLMRYYRPAGRAVKARR